MLDAAALDRAEMAAEARAGEAAAQQAYVSALLTGRAEDDVDVVRVTRAVDGYLAAGGSDAALLQQAAEAVHDVDTVRRWAETARTPVLARLLLRLGAADRDAIDAALAVGGREPASAVLLWLAAVQTERAVLDALLDAEDEAEEAGVEGGEGELLVAAQMQRVRALFHRGLHIPMVDSQRLMDEYAEWEIDEPTVAAVRAEWLDVQAKLSARMQWETALAEAPRQVHKWIQYAESVRETDREAYLDILARAAAHNPGSGALWTAIVVSDPSRVDQALAAVPGSPDVWAVAIALADDPAAMYARAMAEACLSLPDDWATIMFAHAARADDRVAALRDGYARMTASFGGDLTTQLGRQLAAETSDAEERARVWKEMLALHGGCDARPDLALEARRAGLADIVLTGAAALMAGTVDTQHFIAAAAARDREGRKEEKRGKGKGKSGKGNKGKGKGKKRPRKE